MGGLPLGWTGRRALEPTPFPGGHPAVEEECPASFGGGWEPGPPLRVTGALSRTDCAEQLVSNGILVVSLEPLPAATGLSSSPSFRPTMGGGGGAELDGGTLGFQFLKRIQPQGVFGASGRGSKV